MTETTTAAPATATAAKKEPHGGKRANAGRPPRHGTRMVSGVAFSCPVHLLEGVEAMAKTHGLSRSEAIVHCLAETLG